MSGWKPRACRWRERERQSTSRSPQPHADVVSPPPNLRDELEDGVGEERPDGQADEVGQHLGEVGLLGEGDEEEAQQRGQVDHGDRQEAIAPDWGGRRKRRQQLERAWAAGAPGSEGLENQERRWRVRILHKSENIF